MSDSIQLVTFIGRIPRPEEPWYFLEKSLASMRRYGTEPIILGSKEGEWGGLGSKCKLLKKAILSGQLNADYLIVTDSFDVIFHASPEEIVEEFKNIQHLTPSQPSIVFNGEKSCFSDPSLAEHHPKCSSPFRFLNSGFLLGERTGFIKAFEECDPDETLKDDHQDENGKWHHDNDQDWWMRRYLFGDLSMAVDTECRIVQSFHDVTRDEFDFSGHRIKNLVTDSHPLVYHLNGSGKALSWREEIFTKAGI